MRAAFAVFFALLVVAILLGHFAKPKVAAVEPSDPAVPPSLAGEELAKAPKLDMIGVQFKAVTERQDRLEADLRRLEAEVQAIREK